MDEVPQSKPDCQQLAHDIRNALSPILLYAENLEAALAERSLPQEENMARMIGNSVKEMDAMIVKRLSSKDQT